MGGCSPPAHCWTACGFECISPSGSAPSPGDVNAVVVGEHGASEGLLWSTATLAGRPVLDLLDRQDQPSVLLRREIEHDVRYANIAIIAGTGASRFGVAAIKSSSR